MNHQPEQKRIKLFLERSIERLPFDISDKAEELFISEGDPSEKLKRKVKTIVDLAGESYDDFTENLPGCQDKAERDEPAADGAVVKSDNTATAAASTLDQATPSIPVSTVANSNAAQRVTTPQGVYAKLWHAQGEIRIALDVLNIIISSYHAPGINNTTVPVLPPGSLKCEYVAKATMPLSTQISNEMLAIGSKKHHLRKASQILMQGAQKLQEVMDNEDQFWEGAHRLRKNNWCIVSTNTGGATVAQHRTHRIGPSSQLFVHYGFRDVGSLYGDRSYAYAEIVRNPTTLDFAEGGASKSIELHIPNQTGKAVIVSLVLRGIEYSSDLERASGNSTDKNQKITLHSQLLNAQNSLFDMELFQELVNEARTMTKSVSIVDNEIILPINDELELKISYRKPSSDAVPSMSATTKAAAQGLNESQLIDSLSKTADIFRFAMQLIQLRRYRQNNKERMDSFFKSSRPGSGRAPGSFGQFHQSLAQRPTNMLNTALQSLQYYTFLRRIREVLAKVSKPLNESWWEPVSIHCVDVRPPTPSDADMQGAVSSGSSAPVSALANSASRAPGHSMGAAFSIRVGTTSPSLRFVVRSYPAPCIAFQLPDRPTSPLTHVTEFERTVMQELSVRAIRRICEIVNSVENWSEEPEGVVISNPRFVIDIDKRCLGVFQIPSKTNGLGQGRSNAVRTVTVILQSCMRSEEPTTIQLTCTQDGISKSTRLHLEDELSLLSPETITPSLDTVHSYDNPSLNGPRPVTTTTSTRQTSPLRTTDGFKAWIRRKIIEQMALE
ncbi:hypothetical protein BGZ94_005083 [Podila epigama]|nr:hypothetical protein BGZ94_005083 [Podila epigama]